MTQCRIPIDNATPQVAFFLTQDLDSATCTGYTTVTQASGEAMEQTRQNEVDLIVTDRRRSDVRGLEIAEPFIIHLFPRFVQEIPPPSPTEPVLTPQACLRDPLTSRHLFRELRVPLTHTLNHIGTLSHEGDNPQYHLARDPRRAPRMWDAPDDLNHPGEGPIKQFPGYLQTFNLHHVPP